MDSLLPVLLLAAQAGFWSLRDALAWRKLRAK